MISKILNFNYRVRSQIAHLPGFFLLLHALTIILPKYMKVNHFGLKMYIDSRDLRSLKEAFLKSEHNNFMHHAFKNYLQNDMVVIDVGANLGLFTVIAANKVGNNGHVHSFEPVPSCFDLLEKNCNFYNLQNVTTYQNIVANKKEKKELWMDKYYSILGSLSGENLMNKGKKICIDAITLDGLFMDNNNQRVDVIKMNIQGAEGLVIEGAKKLLEEKGPAIFIEFWPYGLKKIGTDPEQLYDKLIDYGYKANLISYLDGSMTQISKNAIFPLDDIESKKSLALYMLFEKP